MRTETVVCVPDRQALIPGGGPVAAVGPAPVMCRARPTRYYTLISDRDHQPAVGYRAWAVAIAVSGGLLLAVGWLVIPVLAVAAAAVMYRRHHVLAVAGHQPTAQPSIAWEVERELAKV